MLVISRHPGQMVCLPSLQVTFTVLEVRGDDRVKIGIEAPEHVAIVREELLTQDQIEELGGE